jgi:hypothetical protein
MRQVGNLGCFFGFHDRNVWGVCKHCDRPPLAVRVAEASVRVLCSMVGHAAPTDCGRNERHGRCEGCPEECPECGWKPTGGRVKPCR